jgi:hypothetical protein
VKFIRQKARDQQGSAELIPARRLDVLECADGTFTLEIEVLSGAISDAYPYYRDSKLKVSLTNISGSPIYDLSVDAYTPDGLQLVNPGDLFGSQRRHVRLGKLVAGQIITYKLGIRVHKAFQQGSLIVETGIKLRQSNQLPFRTELHLCAI